MDEATAKQRMAELQQQLERYNEEYYVQDAPSVTDYEYDMLLRELETLEQQYPQFAAVDSPTKHVGGAASRTFEKVPHTVQMMSLQDVFSYEEMNAFVQKCQEELANPEFSVEPKIDGLSVSLEYTNGVFTRGSTRGDGFVGEDVTANLMTIANIPKKLEHAPAFLEVRGEVYMPRKSFAALVEQQELTGESKNHQGDERHDRGPSDNRFPLMVIHTIGHGQENRHRTEWIGQRKKRSET